MDESLFPPKLHEVEIPLGVLKSHIANEELEAFEAKAAEWRTANRLYCHLATCSHFLGSASEEVKAIKCSKCAKQTCSACKTAWHPKLSCDEREAKELLTKFGFRRCPSCRRVVEREGGCRFMYAVTCPLALRAFTDLLPYAQDVLVRRLVLLWMWTRVEQMLVPQGLRVSSAWRPTCVSGTSRSGRCL